MYPEAVNKENFMDLKRLVLGDLQTNCYILTDKETREIAVVDPSADVSRILDALYEGKTKVKYIILTHTHIDHVMALDELKKETGAQIVVHREEASHLNDAKFTLSALFSADTPKSKADISVSDGDELALGGEKLKFIHTPGHTVGGMCILCGNILVSGDTLFNQSVGRSDFPGGNHSQLIASINDKLMVYPGHGPSTTIGYERENNLYLQ